MSQENQRVEPTEEAGGYGTPTAEQEAAGAGGQGGSGGAETNEPGVNPGDTPLPRDSDVAGSDDEDTVVPSSEADIDAGNSDDNGAGSFSSEPADEAGLPDGSGNDLPKEKSPNDDDESFDAG